MEEKGHLVLGRYCGESIMIDNDVKVIVKSIDRDGLVRLLVEAPRDRAVNRLEIWEKKMRDVENDA